MTLLSCNQHKALQKRLRVVAAPGHPLRIKHRRDAGHQCADKLLAEALQCASLCPSQLCLRSSLVFWTYSSCLQHEHVFITNCRHLDTERVRRLEQNSDNFTLATAGCSDSPWYFTGQVPHLTACPPFNLAHPMLNGTLTQNRAWVSTSGPTLCS